MDMVATYHVRSIDLQQAAEAIAIGQSIGNPHLRLDRETTEMWDRFGCNIHKVGSNGDGTGTIVIGYPTGNLTPRSFVHLLSMIMGGQMDINVIQGCRLLELELPQSVVSQYKGPNKGIAGIRDYLGAYGRPLIGGIVKPKTGITPDELVTICKQMADGGVDFIKEDEILGDIPYCPFEARVEKVNRALEGYKIIYAPCVTSPIEDFPRIAAAVQKLKAPAFHYNVWGGLDAFRVLSMLTGGFSFYQKSGDKVITEGQFSIDFTIWCQLARLAGADFIHAGMIGGYLDEPLPVMRARLHALSKPWHGLQSNDRRSLARCDAGYGGRNGRTAWHRHHVKFLAAGCLHAHPLGIHGGAKRGVPAKAAEGRSYRKSCRLRLKNSAVGRAPLP